jgi:DNA-binding FadR family transcriptional regulator
MPVASRSQRIAESLRDEILTGQYRVGERLPSERDLATRFDVNRGAVREALKKLEQLGLADIQLGGARVCRIEDASLDVIAHLLDLEHPPNPELVDQVLEVFRGVTAMAVRLGVVRASDEDIDRAITLVEKITSTRTSAEEQQQLAISFSEIFVEASGNLVLRLVRHGINMQFLDRLPWKAFYTRIPRAVLGPKRKSLVRALRERDGEAAAREIFEGMKLAHDRVVDALRVERGEVSRGNERVRKTGRRNGSQAND